MAAIVVIWIAIALTAAIVADRKGRSAAGWFVLCFLIPIAILPLLAMGPNEPRPIQVIDGDLIQSNVSGGLRACKECRTLNDAADARCMKCGSIVNAAALLPPPIATEKVCPRCAETVKAAALICRFCNHEFEDAAQPSLPSSQKGRPKTFGKNEANACPLLRA